MTKELLYETIDKIHDIGGKVIATVCDQSSENRSFYNNGMQITKDRPFFTYSGETTFALYDIPHALKNLRNHILDHGLRLANGKILDKALLDKLVDENRTEMKLCPKISKTHITVIYCLLT